MPYGESMWVFLKQGGSLSGMGLCLYIQMYGISRGCGPILCIVRQVCMIQADWKCGVRCILGL